MSTDLYLQGDNTNADLEFADSQYKSVIWPLPRSMKMDMATVLKSSLQYYGLDTAVVVATTGSFLPGMMRDAAFNERTVVVLQRAGDQASREAVGELTDVFTVTDVQSGKVLDPSGILAGMTNTETVLMKEQVSSEIVDVWIFDENEERIEMMYLFLKTCFLAGTRTMMQTLGYTEFLRANGTDAVSMESAGEGGVFVVFQRNLVYQGKHIDFIAGIDQLARLIKETFTATGGPANESISANIE